MNRYVLRFTRIIGPNRAQSQVKDYFEASDYDEAMTLVKQFIEKEKQHYASRTGHCQIKEIEFAMILPLNLD